MWDDDSGLWECGKKYTVATPSCRVDAMGNAIEVAGKQNVLDEAGEANRKFLESLKVSRTISPYL